MVLIIISITSLSPIKLRCSGESAQAKYIVKLFRRRAGFLRRQQLEIIDEFYEGAINSINTDLLYVININAATTLQTCICINYNQICINYN